MGIAELCKQSKNKTLLYFPGSNCSTSLQGGLETKGKFLKRGGERLQILFGHPGWVPK